VTNGQNCYRVAVLTRDKKQEKSIFQNGVGQNELQYTSVDFFAHNYESPRLISMIIGTFICSKASSNKKRN